MSRPEDRISRAADTASRSVPTSGVFERVSRRRRRFAMRRRANAAVLSVMVVGGSIFGTTLLNDTFRPASGGGFVAFVRFLRACPAHPNLSGGLEVFAVDVATVQERRVPGPASFPRGTVPSIDTPEFTPDGSRYVWVDHYRHKVFVTDLATGDTTALAPVAVPPTAAEIADDPTRALAGTAVDRPRISPDGTRVVFSIAGGVPMETTDGTHVVDDLSSIYVVDIFGSAPPVRIATGHLPTWTSDGRVAYARMRTEITIEHVDGGVSINDRPLGLDFHLMDDDGTNDERVYEAPADVQVWSADWSPDGSKVAAEITMHGNTDIYVLDLDSEVPTRLTDDPADDTSPTWSPDGTLIAFHTGRYGTFTGHAEIAMVPADGGDVIRLTHDDCWGDTQPTWIDDPSTVAALPRWVAPPLPDLGEPQVAEPMDVLVGAAIEGIYDLYAIDIVTGEAKNLTADLDYQMSPAWSPDHSRIAFAGVADPSESTGIYTMNADGTDLRRLTDTPGYEDRPAWSPDGTRIAFESRQGISIMAGDGSDLRLVANTEGAAYPTWSPDGAEIAFTGTAVGAVSIVDIDGSNLRDLPAGDFPYDPSWSPDGTTIAFTCERDICVIRPDGTGLQNLTADGRGTYQRDAAWSPDGSTLVFTSDRGSAGEPGLWFMGADGRQQRPLQIAGPWPLDGMAEPSW